MRLKSYFSASVEAAMTEARRELGEDALLIHSRKAPAEAGRPGTYEVVFAAPPAAPSATSAGQAASEPNSRLAGEVAQLRRQVERAAAALARSAALASAYRAVPPAVAELAGELSSAGFSADLAQDLVLQAASSVTGAAAPGERDRLRAAVCEEMGQRLKTDPTLGRAGAEPRLVALVGPPGVGKTTTLVKLAATHGLAARLPTQILSMDTVRIAAAEQLRCCAGILGIGFQVLETTTALAQSLQEHRNKGLILIDTPGFGPKDLDGSLDLALFLSTHGRMDTHLVLAATMRNADMASATSRFEIFQPAKLIFTHLDETESPGAILNEGMRSGRPISFLAAGQQIPEDLESATRERLAGLVTELRSPAAMAAA